MKKNPLGRLDHGTSPAVKSPNVAKSKHTMVNGSKHVNKPVNAHRQNPGFKGKIA